MTVKAHDYIDEPIVKGSPRIVIDKRARNGHLCKLSYKGNTKGCPNALANSSCDPVPIEDMVSSLYCLIAIPFRIKDYMAARLEERPEWSRRQARNIIHWQNAVDAVRKEETLKWATYYWGTPILVPEAHGLNVFATCASVGLYLPFKPFEAERLYKVAVVGRGIK